MLRKERIRVQCQSKKNPPGGFVTFSPNDYELF